MALATTDKTFAADVLSSDKPVLVDFWAPWCGPCRMVAPIIDGIAEKTAGTAKVFKLNMDENPRTAQQFGITGIPTVIVFRNGAKAAQLVGAQPEAAYLKALGN